MNRPRLVAVAALLLAAALGGCTKGKECDTCDADTDCTGGFVCRNFLDEDGNVVGKRCGSGQGLTTCRVR